MSTNLATKNDLFELAHILSVEHILEFTMRSACLQEVEVHPL